MKPAAPDIIGQLLDLNDLERLLKMSPRAIKTRYLKTGMLKAARHGAKWRVRMCDLTKFQDEMARGLIG